MQSETRDSDAVELERVCHLIQKGQTQFFDGDYDGAEKTFEIVKTTSLTVEARNAARILLGCVYERRHHPGKFRDAEENWVNQNWITRAIREYEDVLSISNHPTDEQREYAAAQLAAIFKLRDE